jgi:hypothetical protein
MIEEGGSFTVGWTGASDPSIVDNAGLLYSYDFDNNGSFDLANITQAFVAIPVQFLRNSGIQTIRSIVADKDGGFSESSIALTIQEVAPSLNLTGNNTVAEGSNYNLNLSVIDPGNDSISRWIVDWNDGTVTTVEGATPSLTHQFTDSGAKTITVQAIDNDGVYTATKAVNVTNVAPQVQNLTATATTEGGATILNGTIVDPSPADSFTLLIDWGDGTNPETLNLAAGTTDFRPSHTYANDRTSGYTIAVTATDDDGGSSSATTTVSVGNSTPTIPALALNSNNIGETGTVTLAGSIDDLGTLDTHTVTIVWGDGTTSNAAIDAATRSFSATHSYSDDNPSGTPVDNYSIVATVRDNAGASSTASTIVTVNNVDPLFTAIQPSRNIIGRGQSINLTGSFADIANLDTHTLTIDWGDGTISPATINPNNRTFTATHQYASDLPSGDYSIVATVTDDDGGTNSIGAGITIRGNTPPTTTGIADITVNEDAAETVIDLFAAFNDAESDDNALSYAVTGNTNPNLFGNISIEPTTGALILAYNPNLSGAATLTIRATDPADEFVETSFSVTVNPVNDAPNFTKGTDLTILEDAAAQTIPNWATDISVGPANESGQSRQFLVENNNNALFLIQPTIAPDGTLTYTTAPNANGSAVVAVRLEDSGGTDHGGEDTSIVQSFTINITPVNDVPSFTKGANQTTNENAGEQIVPNWATNLTSGPLDEGTQSLSFSLTTNNNSLFAVLPTIDPDGTLRYTPAVSLSTNRTATISVILKDSGGTDNNGQDTFTVQTFTIAVGITRTGNDSNNTLNGTDGDDYLDGGNGQDNLFGGKGKDTLLGSNGNDNLFGGDDNDILLGGSGNDILLGNNGDDDTNGGAGDDNLRGGAGNDTLRGDSGIDTFILARSEGTDSVADFEDGKDRIGLTGGLNFGQLLIDAIDNRIRIRVASTGEILAYIEGIDLSLITADDFRQV